MRTGDRRYTDTNSRVPTSSRLPLSRGWAKCRLATGLNRETVPDAGDKPRVSVVITTHNRAGLLSRAVDSVLAQTYKGYELIIVDDCSADNTPAVMLTFADSRIRAVRHADNMGQSAALNAGIRLARGEYIAFLDDDDEWIDQKLTLQVRALDASDPIVGLVYTWFDRVDTTNGVRIVGGRDIASGDISEEMLGWELPAPTSTYLVRAEAARQIGGFDEALKIATDRDFLTRLSMHWHVAVVPKVLMLLYGGHARSAQRPQALDRLVEYLNSHIRKFTRELGERPSKLAKLLRVLAVTEMRRGNVRGAVAAYLRAFTLDPLSSLRATGGNVDLIGRLLWQRIRRARG